MDFKLKPKEEKFFSILNKHVELCSVAAGLMNKSFIGEVSKEEAYKKVDALEREADELVIKTSEMLMKTFITPIDREDIQSLIEQLDDTIDSIKDIMERMVMYNVDEPSEGTKELAVVVEKSVNQVAKSISYMSNLKKNHLKVEARAIKVSELESKGDDLYHKEMALLFTECQDAIKIIKWKGILDSMEDVIDGCEKLVGTFRRVVLKYA